MLGVSAFASVKNLFNSGADYLTRYAVAQPFAVWHDKFTVQSSALAIGTPVTVQITQVIDIAHALASSSDFFYLEPMAGGLISFMSSYAPAEYCIATGRYGNGRFGYDFCSGKQALMEGSNMITYESVFRVGQVVDWSSMLHAEANVEIEGSLFNKGIGVGSVLMDAIHTAQTYFSVADASTNLAWESGHDYTVPVPEPETYAMMLAGLGLIGAAVKRRRSKQA
jgi:hypothetical protein